MSNFGERRRHFRFAAKPVEMSPASYHGRVSERVQHRWIGHDSREAREQRWAEM